MRFPVHSTRLRALLAASVAVAALGVAPGVARAASVSAAGGTVTYTAAPGEANHVTVTPWGLTLRVSETGTKADHTPIRLTAGTGCHALSYTAAWCVGGTITANTGDGDDFFDSSLVPLASTTVSGGAGNDQISTGGGADTLDGGPGADGLSGGAGIDTVTYASATGPVVATLGGGTGNGQSGENDSIAADVESLTGGAFGDTLTGDGAANVLSGGAGSDTLRGGAGIDTLDGGDGDDTFQANDGEADAIVCGGGTDSGTDDAADSVGPDCEAVRQELDAGTDPAGPDPGVDVTAPPTDGANAVPPTIPAQTVVVSANGIASVQVVCPPDSGGCSGTVTLELPPVSRRARRGKLAVSARRHAPLRIGRARFKAKAGTSPVIPVRLSRRGRQRILRGRHSGCRVKIATRRADGTVVVTARQVLLSARREARSRARR